MINWIKNLFKKHNKKLLVQVLINNKWKLVSGLNEVKTGQVFRMVDPSTKKPVIIDNSSLWRAVEDGKIDEHDGVGKVNADVIE